MAVITNFLDNFKKNNSSLKSRLIKRVSGSFGLKIGNTALGFVLSVVLAHILGAKGLGEFVYAISWTTLLAIPASLGFDQLLVREVSIYQTKKQWDLMRGIINFANRSTLTISIFISIFAIFASSFLIQEEQNKIIIYIALVSLPIIALRNVNSGAIRGLDRIIPSILPQLLIAPSLLILLTVVTYFIIGNKLDAIWVLLIFFLVNIIVLVILLGLLNKAIPKAAKKVNFSYKVKSWISLTFPMMFIQGIQIIYSRTDLIMLGILDKPESVGIYSVVVKIAQLVVFVFLAISTAIEPTIASLHSNQEFEKLRAILKKIARFLTLTSIPVSLIIIIFSYWILAIFGNEFTQGQYSLMILTVGQLFNSMIGPVSQVLTMTGNEKYSLITLVFSSILNIILNALLIPQFGLNGAALATATCLIVVNVLNWLYVKKILGITISIF